MKYDETDFYDRLNELDEGENESMDYKVKLLLAFLAGNVTGAVGSILLGCL